MCEVCVNVEKGGRNGSSRKYLGKSIEFTNLYTHVNKIPLRPRMLKDASVTGLLLFRGLQFIMLCIISPFTENIYLRHWCEVVANSVTLANLACRLTCLLGLLHLNFILG